MRLLCAVIAGLLFLTGCSGDTSEADPKPSSSATDEPVEATLLSADELASALLTTDDLPRGFEVDDSESEDGDESTDEIIEASSDSCSDLWEETESPFDEGDYPEAEAAFTNGELGPFVYQYLIAVDEETVADEFAGLQLAVESCTDFVTRDADGFETTFTLTPIEAPDLGDKNFAFQMALVFSDGDFEVEGTMTAVMTSIGGHVMMLMSVQFDLGETMDDDEFTAIAESAVEKLAGAVEATGDAA
ncbi:hypothetical protein [Aeromicrobium alkaliterrae]|uniref:PknH-like extracellular domain-containing protein n=1 Tax=Aeromicrobium alkaliterrae TaxID=302168 RepID=A0ABP4W196_9ACTN